MSRMAVMMYTLCAPDQGYEDCSALKHAGENDLTGHSCQLEDSTISKKQYSSGVVPNWDIVISERQASFTSPTRL